MAVEINSDKVRWVLLAVTVSYYRVNLKRPGALVCPIVPLDLPPGSKACKQSPKEKHGNPAESEPPERMPGNFLPPSSAFRLGPLGLRFLCFIIGVDVLLVYRGKLVLCRVCPGGYVCAGRLIYWQVAVISHCRISLPIYPRCQPRVCASIISH